VITQDESSWQAGYNAGSSGVGASTCPPEIPDALAYQSGYIEGAAARARPGGRSSPLLQAARLWERQL
jgi:hypothetical protein